MVTENPKLQSLMEQLKSQFSPIYDATPLSDREGYVSADACLHADILALGLQLATFDTLSARFERNLLAELLSFLISDSGNMPYSYVLQTIDNQIAAAKPSVAKGEWPVLSSITIAKNWANGSPSREHNVRALLATLSDIINTFVIRDGKVSNDEINLLKDFELHFAL